MQLGARLGSPDLLKVMQYNPLLYYTYYAQVQDMTSKYSI
jgi:hypothetical protein